MAESSSGCSGMSESVGGAGVWAPGGVEDALRAEDEPLRDTQDVSITRTPMLQQDRETHGASQVTGG